MIFKLPAVILMLLTITGTLLPFSKSEAWYIRIMDFPRLQFFFLGIIGIIGYFFSGNLTLIEYFLLGITSLTIVYQASKIFPYTFLYPSQVKKINPKHRHYSRDLCVIISNVRMKNRNFSKALNTWKEANPDLLLLVETNQEWDIQTRELEEIFPYFLKVPLENTYGMILYSRLKLIDSKVNYLVEKRIPSFECLLELKSGDQFYFYGIHPRPPAPTQSESSLPRDTELLIVADEAKKKSKPVIVAGDLNDVAWSFTTDLFQNISGLLDPRVGRGMYSTYHAGIPFMRWPLDHLFHSNQFSLVHIKRLPNIGSDHYPILIHLNYQPQNPVRHNIPEATEEDKQEAREKMRKAQSKNILSAKSNRKKSH